MVVLFSVNLERYHEAHGFLRGQSVHNCGHQGRLILLVRLWCFLAALRFGHTIKSCLDAKLLNRVGRYLVLNGEENFEVFAHADLAK